MKQKTIQSKRERKCKQKSIIIGDYTSEIASRNYGVASSEKTQRPAFKVTRIAQKNNISTSKNPMRMAVSAVHLAMVMNNEKVSQLRISGISPVKMRQKIEIKKIIGGEING